MKKKPLPIIKLNVGCGETKLKGFVNIDRERKVKPDVVWDVTKKSLPFKDKTITQINCVHNIEHIEFRKWEFVLTEFHRVLKVGGRLILAYPEFEVCVKHFLENFRNQRNFFRATLYGRQLYPGDYHVSPVVTSELVIILQNIGFDDIKHAVEVDAPNIYSAHNTFLSAKKIVPMTREDVIKREVFGR